MTDLEYMRLILREKEMPMFSDEELEAFIKKEGNVHSAIYAAALMKSENTTLQVNGLTIPDTSAYFLRIARTHRAFNTGVLADA